jgi:cell division protein ZapA (FtsZ GTPase activity inhibitor)
MLVMASLLMADDLFELGNRLAAAEAAHPGEAKPDPRLAHRLNRMAKRAEDIAEDLEHP